MRRRVALFAFGSAAMGGPPIEARGVLLAILARLAAVDVPWPSRAALARELGHNVAWLRERLGELEPVVSFGPGERSGSAPVRPLVAVELLEAWMAGEWEWPRVVPSAECRVPREGFVVRKSHDYCDENRTTNGALCDENRTTASRAGVNPPPPHHLSTSSASSAAAPDPLPQPRPGLPEADLFEREVLAAKTAITTLAGIKVPGGAIRPLRAFMARGITVEDVTRLAEMAAVKSIVSFSWFVIRFEELLRARESEGNVVRIEDYQDEPRPWAGGGL